MSTFPLGNGLTLVAAAMTHIGRVRKLNQDSIGILDTGDADRGFLLTVADGMGGAVGGEIASRMTVDAVHHVFVSADARADNALAEAVAAANDCVFSRSQRETELNGMGTTCTTLAITSGDFYIAHVGDSRAYVCDDSGFRQVTNDHSLAEEIRRQSGGGVASPAVPRNILSRCLGVEPEVEVDIVSGRGRIAEGLKFLMCSDGLSGLVSSEEMHEAVRRQPPDVACRDLIHQALERGAPDNVSVIVAAIVAG